MANETKNEEIQEEKVTEAAEDIEEYIEDEYENSGYKEHAFSLFDNPIEISTVVFMFAVFIYSVWKFIVSVDLGDMTWQLGIEYWLDVVGKMIPAVVLLVACEIYEKIHNLEYNVKINSYYMAEYHTSVMSKLTDNSEESEQ